MARQRQRRRPLKKVRRLLLRRACLSVYCLFVCINKIKSLNPKKNFIIPPFYFFCWLCSRKKSSEFRIFFWVIFLVNQSTLFWNFLWVLFDKHGEATHFPATPFRHTITPGDDRGRKQGRKQAWIIFIDGWLGRSQKTYVSQSFLEGLRNMMSSDKSCVPGEKPLNKWHIPSVFISE